MKCLCSSCFSVIPFAERMLNTLETLKIEYYEYYLFFLNQNILMLAQSVFFFSPAENCSSLSLYVIATYNFALKPKYLLFWILLKN